MNFRYKNNFRLSIRFCMFFIIIIVLVHCVLYNILLAVFRWLESLPKTQNKLKLILNRKDILVLRSSKSVLWSKSKNQLNRLHTEILYWIKTSLRKYRAIETLKQFNHSGKLLSINYFRIFLFFVSFGTNCPAGLECNPPALASLVLELEMCAMNGKIFSFLKLSSNLPFSTKHRKCDSSSCWVLIGRYIKLWRLLLRQAWLLRTHNALGFLPGLCSPKNLVGTFKGEGADCHSDIFPSPLWKFSYAEKLPYELYT